MGSLSSPAFALKTGLIRIAHVDLSMITMALAADGSLWMADETNLYAFDFSVNGFVQLINIDFNSQGSLMRQSLAAADAQTCYFLNREGGVSCYKGGVLSVLPVLPGAAGATSVAAAADGTLVSLGSDGAVYSYHSGGWGILSLSPGMTIQMVSAGSSAAILALSVVNGQPAVMQYTSSGWTNFVSAVPPGITWISACADGSWWYWHGVILTLAVAGQPALSFPPMPSLFYFGGNVAPSCYACLYVDGIEIYAACNGAMDQPVSAWPEPTADWNAGYTAISASLEINEPGGVRALYADQTATPTVWFTEVSLMGCPAGVSAANWTLIQAQISTELKYVIAVQKLFGNLTLLNNEVNIEQLYCYNQVVEMVGLPDQPAQQPNSIVSVILGALFSKLLSAAVSRCPERVGQVVQVGISVFQFAANAVAQKHGAPDLNAALQVACSELSALLDEMNNTRLQTEADWQNSILGDWNKLSSCGAALASGIWYWPAGFDVSVLKGIGNSIQLNYYQTLMPAKWQLMKVVTVLVFNAPPGNGYLPYTPPYTFLYQALQDASNDTVYWWICCTDQGTAASQYNQGPYPNQGLMEAVLGLCNHVDFFTNANGWNLPVVEEDGYTPPPAGVPFRNWDDSTSPYSELAGEGKAEGS